VLGTGGIARSFVGAVRSEPEAAGARVVAVASRTAERADAFARDFGVARAHAGYTALLADPGVDAVYNALPTGLHAEWSVRAAGAGKHVLCEKPLAVTAADVAAMYAAADAAGVVLLEAFPYAYHPQMHATLALLRGGAVGAVRAVHAAFGFTLDDAANVRFDAALGGGALLDVGCYAVSFARRVVGERPARAHATARWSPSGVDLALAGTLEYPGGAVAQVACSFEAAPHRYAVVAGSDGVLETGFPNHTRPAPPEGPAARPREGLRVRRGRAWDAPVEEVPVPAASGFVSELAAFAAMVRAPGGPAERDARARSRDDAAALDALRASARDGRPVELPPPRAGA
jgi:predicted dehydrogenase